MIDCNVYCWVLFTPSNRRNCSYFGFESALVKMSASILSVLQWTTLTIPAFTAFRVKWNFISMCFDLSWSFAFFDHEIAPVLSSWTVVAPDWGAQRSFINRRNHTASCTAALSAMLSASAVDKATTDCFLDFQLTFEFATRNTNPDVDLRSPMSPAH